MTDNTLDLEATETIRHAVSVHDSASPFRVAFDVSELRQTRYLLSAEQAELIGRAFIESAEFARGRTESTIYGSVHADSFASGGQTKTFGPRPTISRSSP